MVGGSVVLVAAAVVSDSNQGQLDMQELQPHIGEPEAPNPESPNL